MIVERENDNPSIVAINLGRPNYFREEDFLFWEKVYDVIENSDIKIRVNDIYEKIRTLCTERMAYGGGGFRFEFFFTTFDECERFEEAMKKLGFYLTPFGRRLLPAPPIET